MNRVFWSALFFKLCCGILLGALYLHYLGLRDTWKFHAVTLDIVELARQKPSWFVHFLCFNDVSEVFIKWKEASNSFFFLKLLSLLYLLTNDSYWWSGAYLSLFSFFGCWFLVQQVRRYFPAYGHAAVLAFLFFPSMVFWTSGVLKDSLFMGSLCLTIGLLLQLYRATAFSEAAKKILLLLPCMYLLWRVKFFLAAVLLVVTSAYLLSKWVSRQLPWLQMKGRFWMAWLGILGSGAFIMSFAHPTFNTSFFARHILWNAKSIITNSDPGKPLIMFPDLQPTLLSVIEHAPEALLQMLFRPYLWETAPVFYKMVAMENLFLLLLMLLSAIHIIRRKEIPALPAFLGILLVFFCISAVLVTLPTPNIGSLHRYRSSLLPFFLLVVLAWGPLPGALRKRLCKRH